MIREFLYIPECPVPLLGRDLLSKPGTQVTFSPEETHLPNGHYDLFALSLSQSHPKMSGAFVSLLKKN